jgi:hypothetical protein
VPTELTEDTKKQNLVDQIVKVFKVLWDEDEDDTRAMATSTDNEDSAQGTPRIDKVLLARAIQKLAPSVPGCDELAEAKVDAILKVMHHATKRVGIDRVAIAAHKAEILAVQASEPMEPSTEQSLDGRRDDEPSGSGQ